MSALLLENGKIIKKNARHCLAFFIHGCIYLYEPWMALVKVYTWMYLSLRAMDGISKGLYMDVFIYLHKSVSAYED